MHFTKKIAGIFSLFVLLLIASCSDPKSPLSKYGPELEGVMRFETGTFRGFDLGTKLDTVLAKEQGPGADADEGYLYYEFKLKDSDSYNISYSFDEIGLSEIQSDIYLTDPKKTERVFNAFKSYFDDHLGTSENHQGFFVWTVKSESYGDVRINLSDESSDFTIPGSPGKIALWIYPDKE